jgi:hypothetical protein
VVEARASGYAIGAHRDRRDGTTNWVGTGRGVRIEGTDDAQGRIVAARPTPQQPPVGALADGAQSLPVVAEGPAVTLTLMVGSYGWQRMVARAMLLSDGQIGYHATVAVRLVAAPGTGEAVMTDFRREMAALRLSGTASPDSATGQRITVGIVEEPSQDAEFSWQGGMEVTVNPDGSWSAADRAPAPVPDLLGLALVTMAAEHLHDGISQLREDVLPLLMRQRDPSWRAVSGPGAVDGAPAVLWAEHPVPDRPVWPAAEGLPSLGLPEADPGE